MSVTRRALRHRIAQRLAPFLTGTADGGSTVTLVDAAQLQDSTASADLWTDSWVHVFGGPNAGETRRVAAYDPAEGSITVSRAFPHALDAASSYELLRLVAPDVINAAINATLTRCWFQTLTPLTALADGGMDNPDTRAWRTWNASAAKVAAGSDAASGATSLEVSNRAVGGYAASTSLAVLPGQPYTLEASVAPGGFTARLAVHNLSSGVDLDAVTASGLAWRRVRLTFAIPEGCEEIEIRLGGEEADAVTGWDQAILLAANRRRFPLPAWITHRQQVVEVWRRAADHPQRVMSAVTWWRTTSNPGPVGPELWLEADPPPSIGETLMIEGLRAYAPLASDEATTDAPVDWVAQGAQVEVYRHLRRDAPAGDVVRYEALQRDAALEFQHLSRLYRPRATRRVMLSGGL